MSTINSNTLTQLQNIFPNVVLINSHQAASALGIAYRTLNNAGNNFPIKPVKFGRNKFYRLIDIAAFIDTSLSIVPPSTQIQIALLPAPTQQRKRPGRPPNITQQKRGTDRPRKNAQQSEVGRL